jgi:hypothetical protein
MVKEFKFITIRFIRVQSGFPTEATYSCLFPIIYSNTYVNKKCYTYRWRTFKTRVWNFFLMYLLTFLILKNEISNKIIFLPVCMCLFVSVYPLHNHFWRAETIFMKFVHI